MFPLQSFADRVRRGFKISRIPFESSRKVLSDLITNRRFLNRIINSKTDAWIGQLFVSLTHVLAAKMGLIYASPIHPSVYGCVEEDAKRSGVTDLSQFVELRVRLHATEANFRQRLSPRCPAEGHLGAEDVLLQDGIGHAEVSGQ